MPLPASLDLGAVTNGHRELETEGYLTYQFDGEEGEIKIEGPMAARIAARIAKLWNDRD